jgi:hypothetical protein
MGIADRVYFEERRKAELARAENCDDDAIARLHCEMADEYARRLRDEPSLQPQPKLPA